MKLYNIAILLLIVFNSFVTAKETPEELTTRAQNLESGGQYSTAGGLYMDAAKGYYEKAQEAIRNKFRKSVVYENLKKAEDSYQKAAENYQKGNSFRSKDLAEQEAAKVAMEIASGGWEYSAYDDKKVEFDEEVPEKKKISDELGKEVLFKCNKSTLAITPPKAMNHSGPDYGMKAARMMSVGLESREPKIEIGVIEQDLAIFGQQSDNGGTKKLCDELADKDLSPAANLTPELIQKINEMSAKTGQKIDIEALLGLKIKYDKKMIKISGVDACMSIKESKQHNTDGTLEVILIFVYNGAHYKFAVFGPLDYKNILMKSVESIRIAGKEEPITEKCSGKETKPIPGLAIRDTFLIPDPDSQVKIWIKPNLSRRTVPKFWLSISEKIQNGLKAYDRIRFVLKGKEKYYENEKMDEFFAMELAFGMLELAELSPSFLASQYLKVFDKAVIGISGLEGKITNMTADLDFEVPYIRVITQCVPRLKCVDGQWKPDMENVSYEEVSRVRDVRKADKFLNQTPRQIKDRQQRYVIEFIERLEKDQAKLSNAKNCEKAQNMLWSVKFPVSPDECDKAIAEVKGIEFELDFIKKQVENLQRELANYNIELPAKITKIEVTFSSVKNELSTAEKDLKKVNDDIRRWEQNKKNAEKTQYEGQMQMYTVKKESLEYEINSLKMIKASISDELDEVKSFKYENAKKADINALIKHSEKLVKDLHKARYKKDECEKQQKLYKK